MLKFSPLSVVDPEKSFVFPVGVEYTFNNNWAVGADIGIPVSMIRNTRNHPKPDLDIKARLEVRKYFKSRTDARGVVGVRAFYRQIDYGMGRYYNLNGTIGYDRYWRRSGGAAFMGGWIVPIGFNQFLEWSGGVAVGGIHAETNKTSGYRFEEVSEGTYAAYIASMDYVGDDWIVYPTMVVKFGVLLGRRNKIFR
jgi:hypothetical protein